MTQANKTMEVEQPLKVIYTEEEVNAVLQRIITYGKYKGGGTTMDWITKKDPAYFEWIVNKMCTDGMRNTKTCQVYIQVIEERIPIDNSQDILKYGRFKGESLLRILKDNLSYFSWLLKVRQESNPFSSQTRYMEYIKSKH